MKSKKISKLLNPLSGIVSFMLVMGVMAVPVSAAETISSNTNEQSVIAAEQKKDYATYIDSTTEKNGIKITLNKITASKHKLNVVCTIQNSEAFNEDNMKNTLFVATIKGLQCESQRNNTRKIDDKTLEVDFNFDNMDGFPDSADIRFDVIIPYYNLNGWVKTQVDLSQNFDKIIEKDIKLNIDKANLYFNKFESDVLGSRVYYNCPENEDIDHEELYSDSDSIILIKYNNKLYEMDDKSNDYKDHGEIGTYTCKELTYDDLKDNSSYSLLPVICKVTNKEKNHIYEKLMGNEITTETSEGIMYSKTFRFSDGKNGEITKLERNDDKVKVYCETDSEKKSLLMAIGIKGRCWSEDNYNNNIGKLIYKNPENNNQYIIEFSNVKQGSVLYLYNDDEILGCADKYEIADEIKID